MNARGHKKPPLVAIDTKLGTVRRYIPKPVQGVRPHGNYFDGSGVLPAMGDDKSLAFIENYRLAGA